MRVCADDLRTEYPRASRHDRRCSASHQLFAWGGIPSDNSVFHARVLRAEVHQDVTLDEAHEMNGIAWRVLGRDDCILWDVSGTCVGYIPFY
jgi:hypothetical protein